MFSPHLSTVQAERSEPQEKLDLEKINKKIKKRNAELAEKIIIKGWLKRPKPKVRANKKLKRIIEFEERVKLASDFLEIWNHWRWFYFDLSPMKIKTAGQLTSIEKIRELSEEEGLDLNMLIATTHKAFVWRKVRPGFTTVTFNGKEFYYRYYDEVVKDVDRQDYIEDSLE